MSQTITAKYTWGEYLEALPACKSISVAEGGDWTDGESFTSALRKMTHGDDAYVPMADKLLDKIGDLAEGLPVRQWTPSPCGAYGIVPEAIMGLPTPMRTMAPSGDLSPVNIIVSTTCSGGIDKATMTKRGVAILALLQKLQAIRPVELSILAEGGSSMHGNVLELIQIDTKPLSIAHACFALANVGFARGLTYAHMEKYHGFNGRWPADYRTDRYGGIVREALDIRSEDLWIQSSHLTDSKLTSDPVAWVNEQLARYGASE